jgi:hypothetical protein
MGRQDAIACTFCRCLFFAERAKHRVGKSGSFQGFQKFHPHQMKLPRRLLPAHPRLNWRCLWREAAGRCWRWGGDGQLEHAIIPQHSCTHSRNAPVPLMSSVLERSTNSAPLASCPRMNKGICKRRRGERPRSVEINGILFRPPLRGHTRIASTSAPVLQSGSTPGSISTVAAALALTPDLPSN